MVQTHNAHGSRLQMRHDGLARDGLIDIRPAGRFTPTSIGRTISYTAHSVFYPEQ